MQKKASIPLCFSTVLGGKIGACCFVSYTILIWKSAARPNARKNAMSYSVPCIRYPRALAMPSSPIFWAYSSFFYAVLFIKRRQSPTLRKNALSYTHPCTVSWNATIQCNAMQCNAMQWHSPTLEKTLCHAPFLAYDVLGRSPCC